MSEKAKDMAKNYFPVSHCVRHTREGGGFAGMTTGKLFLATS